MTTDQDDAPWDENQHSVERSNDAKPLRDVAPAFNLLYENGPTLAVNKQPGVLTQAPQGVDSIEARVKEFMNLREERAGRRYVGLPHRLDRPASGILVMTKHARAARRLSDQFHERTVVKKYWALVSGIVTEDFGTWEDFMRKIPGRAEAEIISPIHADAREAILNFKTLARLPEKNVSWLEIQLETGRTHQIRLQCASRGFPLLGDELYGSTVPFGEQFEDARERAIALHSREMTFVDFLTKEKVTLRAPLYEPWSKWLPAPEGEAFVTELYLKPIEYRTNIYGVQEQE
ncbi:MAG: RNA pseudouridine synthase [Planctomycetia bacterium]|nr:RNA pseudouridine synthase [Planctomycetia bacterium]